MLLAPDSAPTWVPRIVAVAAFCLYALAAPPGFYWLDSAELTAAAVRLGSPHPTGFPLLCVAGRAASLIPLGELAFRVELVSAGCAALAVLWTAGLVCRRAGAGQRDPDAWVAGAAAGATLAVSLVFFRQATVAEVYAPIAAMVAGTLVLFDRVARGGDARFGLVLAVVCGLGLSLHVTFALLGPAVVALLAVRLYRGARWPLLAPLLCAIALLASLSYLPLRSATGRTADVDWGHPRDLAGLVDHVTAGRIRRAHGDEMRSTSPPVVAHDAARFGRVVDDSPGPLALLAGLAGLVWLARKKGGRWLALALACLAGGDAVYSVWINPMGISDLQNTILLALATCVAAGFGLAWLGRSLGPVGPYVAAVAGLIVALPPALIAGPEIWPGRSSDRPRAFAEAALDNTGPRGVALVQNDSTAAGTLYLSAAEGARPDVAVLVRQHLADRARTRAVLAASGSVPADFEARPLASLVAGIRPLTWEIGRDAPPPGTYLVADAPLAHLRRQGDRQAGPDAPPDAPPDDPIDPRRDIRAAAEILARLVGGGRDREAERVHGQALTGLGRLAYARGDGALAARLFEAAIVARPEHVAAWVNRGVVAARRGDYAAARDFTERALALDPNRVGALVNATRYHLRLGDDGLARARVLRALAIDPGRADAWALAGLIDLRAGDPERALERIQRALTLDPGDPDARDILRQLEARRSAPTP